MARLLFIMLIFINLLVIAGCGQGEGVPEEILISIITNIIFTLMVIISGVAGIFFYFKPKRYYGELAVVMLTLVLCLNMFRTFLSNSVSPLLAVSGLIVAALAIVVSSVRLVRKIKKGD